jgi:hypothetical protein
MKILKLPIACLTILILSGCSLPFMKAPDSRGFSPGCIPAPQGAVSDELKTYFSDTALQIYRQWKTDGLQYDSRLSVLARIQILPDGTIDKIHLEEKSGNARFDDSVYNAIADSNPLVPYRQGDGFKCINLGLRFISPDKPSGDGPQ